MTCVVHASTNTNQESDMLTSSFRPSVRFAARLFIFAVAASSLAACHNYTAAPVCSEANAAMPPGLTGVYTLSVQNDDFTTQTTEIEVLPQRNGHGIIKRRDGDEEASAVCQVGGHFIQESLDEATGGYTQERLYVTGMGLTTLPVFYDRQALADAGITAKVIEVPQGVRRVVGAHVAGMAEALAARAVAALGESVPGLLVHNETTPAAQLMSYGLAGPLGLTLLRK
jgi:hypothetical protein